MKPQNNGLVEMVDERSTGKCVCMKLVAFITNDPQFDKSWEFWHARFIDAENKRCAYKGICPQYARTMANRTHQPQQLTLWQ